MGAFDDLPAVATWIERVRAIGHGERVPVSRDAALNAAKTADPLPADPASADPLLGKPVSSLTYEVLAVMALAGWITAFLVFARTRRRIVHYL